VLHVQDFFEFGKVWELEVPAQRVHCDDGWKKDSRLVSFKNDGCCSHLRFLLGLKSCIDRLRMYIYRHQGIAK
jgi:hypothetical protein